MLVDRLKELSADVIRWRELGILEMSGKTARGEHEQRKKFCYVEDVEVGETRCFDAHAYFTGGIPGRIHFFVDTDRYELVVAYAGFKIDRHIGG
ncbi:hypothetical protein DT603_09290 [Pseudoxanthomonas gei]|uniref:Uncharacterized protein n=2 Tax=Pseudoxanthomonas gei TaxID=1383030 RepID=A0ABX0ADS7_9GAMM|nr:hypothetical protein [Pseudoxanthomonas gei]